MSDNKPPQYIALHQTPEIYDLLKQASIIEALPLSTWIKQIAIKEARRVLAEAEAEKEIKMQK